MSERMTREHALGVLKTLTAEQREAVATIAETCEAEGDYVWDGEGSTWMDSVSATLEVLAKLLRGTKLPSDA